MSTRENIRLVARTPLDCDLSVTFVVAAELRKIFKIFFLFDSSIRRIAITIINRNVKLLDTEEMYT